MGIFNTPLQVGLHIPNLQHNLLKLRYLNTFVRIYARCSWVGAYITCTLHFFIFSAMIYLSPATCLVQSVWWTGSWVGLVIPFLIMDTLILHCHSFEFFYDMTMSLIMYAFFCKPYCILVYVVFTSFLGAWLICIGLMTIANGCAYVYNLLDFGSLCQSYVVKARLTIT